MTFGESLCDSARALLSCLRFPETYPSPNPKRVLVTQTLRQCSAGRTNIRSYRVAAAGRVNFPTLCLTVSDTKCLLRAIEQMFE
jgi:hypothetical protein